MGLILHRSIPSTMIERFIVAGTMGLIGLYILIMYLVDRTKARRRR